MLASLREYGTQMRVERSGSWSAGTSGCVNRNVVGLQMSKLSTLLEVEK
jgi:hypothetical protein